jgi:hypothetical protein
MIVSNQSYVAPASKGPVFQGASQSEDMAR